jgi:triosephosphate isomerase
MNTNLAEALALAESVARQAEKASNVDVAICVPFPYLPAVKDAAAGTRLLVGAQNVHQEPKGAFTGEVSLAMLADFCDLVIIGHSERRHVFGESDDVIHLKLVATLASGIDPILCVGETLDERRAEKTFDVLSRQVRSALAGLQPTARLTVAYEPVWAIGTGETATPEIAQEACAFVREELRAVAGDVADNIRVQYGGSVNPGNAAELLGQPDIDGALVGGASLVADQFAAIIAAAG